MTFDPSQPHQFQPPEPAGGPAPAARPVPPSFIPPGVALGASSGASRSRISMGAVAFVAAVTVAAAGLGFAGGRVTAPQSTARTFVNGNGNGFGGFGNGNGGPNASGAPGAFGGSGFGGFGGTVAITGSVTAIADGSITIQQANGRSVTLTVPGTATYHAETGASAADVAVGSQVEVTVDRVAGFRGPNASGAPGASPQAGNGPTLTVSDILVLGK